MHTLSQKKNAHTHKRKYRDKKSDSHSSHKSYRIGLSRCCCCCFCCSSSYQRFIVVAFFLYSYHMRVCVCVHGSFFYKYRSFSWSFYTISIIKLHNMIRLPHDCVKPPIKVSNYQISCLSSPVLGF